MGTTEVLTAVASGDLDDDLDRLLEAVRDRKRWLQKQQAAIVRASLDVGTKVRFVEPISPKYLVGVEATVIEVPGDGRVQVRVDDDWSAKRYRGVKTRCPAELLEVV